VSTRQLMSDQRTVSCLNCSRSIPYNRWSGRPRLPFCNDDCRRSWEIRTGQLDPINVFKERATDPNVCIICKAPLQKVRGDRLYCSPRCQKRGNRLGINADSLGRVRLDAIEALDRVSVSARGH